MTISPLSVFRVTISDFENLRRSCLFGEFLLSPLPIIDDTSDCYYRSMMYQSFSDLVLIEFGFLVIAMTIDIAYLRNAQSFDMLVRSLFSFLSRVELVLFVRT